MKLRLLRIILNISILAIITCCTTFSVVDKTWLTKNCPNFPTFYAENCSAYSNCSKTGDTTCMCKLENGDWYGGEFKDGVKHGYGGYDWVDGTSYLGYWNNGVKSCGIESDKNSNYSIYKDGKVIKSGNNISEITETTLTVLLVAGAAYAIANSEGSSPGYTSTRSDTDWDWDWQPGNSSWVCRGIDTGQYATLDKCQYDIKNDSRWPNN